MTVVNLADRRRIREAVRTCPSCRGDSLCYPHRLDDLSARLRGAQADVLLVPATVLDDALEVIDGIVRECLPVSERSAR